MEQDALAERLRGLLEAKQFADLEAKQAGPAWPLRHLGLPVRPKEYHFRKPNLLVCEWPEARRAIKFAGPCSQGSARPPSRSGAGQTLLLHLPISLFERCRPAQLCHLSAVPRLQLVEAERTAPPARPSAAFAPSCFCCKLVASLPCIGGQVARPARTLSPAALGVLAL